MGKRSGTGVQKGRSVQEHPDSCPCRRCEKKSRTLMFSEASPVAEGEEVTAEATQAAEEEVPAEVEAMDGIESNEEAHNSDRPARESLKKKRARKGTALSEFEVGASVKAS